MAGGTYRFESEECRDATGMAATDDVAAALNAERLNGGMHVLGGAQKSLPARLAVQMCDEANLLVIFHGILCRSDNRFGS